jgi:hypothetical protein
VGPIQRPADYKSAIRQIENLRYGKQIPWLPLEFGHSGVPIPFDLPEGETKIARQFTAGEELESIESRRDG